jgi:hypothetical protein
VTLLIGIGFLSHHQPMLGDFEPTIFIDRIPGLRGLLPAVIDIPSEFVRSGGQESPQPLVR